MERRTLLSRRELMSLAAAAASLASLHTKAAGDSSNVERAQPFPLEAVRLKPSIYLDAIHANRGYLLRVEPDRLLHNFRRYAGLEPKAPVYGGWESDTIAGHTLGHYLSACALMYAQTGDAAFKQRVIYIVAELAECQSRSLDGYVAGFSRRRGDQIEDGRKVFEELARGEIRAVSFNLNGSWVPFYTWHKLMAGLLDAHRYCDDRQALAVTEKLGGFIEAVFAGLSDEQTQTVLDCEHGGLNESFAELHARTHDARWLKLAERIRHRKVLDPLTARRDELSNIHSNTQIPKLIGLARLYEITGNEHHASAAEFFWQTVVDNHSYVIGGNGDREYFQAPRSVSRYITEQTCEACCTYNMLKLTRHLYQWNPHASYFDYYERAHLNHIMAHQNPVTGMFAYMMPLMSGSAREFSKPFDDFWCCVGSGMESHAKHGDSIYWHAPRTLYVNLYIPSRLEWAEQGMSFELDSGFPSTGEATLRIAAAKGRNALTVAMRIPSWAENATVEVNGKPHDAPQKNGYAMVRRRWRAGDVIRLKSPMSLRVEPTPDDPTTVAVLYGPAVLAADLGPASAPFDGATPALIGSNVLTTFRAGGQASTYEVTNASRPAPMVFRPFYAQHERRTAVYFRVFDEAGWRANEQAQAAEQAQLRELDARSTDVIRLGETQSESAHQLQSKQSYAVTYRGKPGRDARSGGFIEFTMKTQPGALALRATYWGDERRRSFQILVDGQRIASQQLDGQHPARFVDLDYAIPLALTNGKSQIRIRFEPDPDRTAGPVFGCRVLPLGTTSV
jgi:uncharacterized protein